MSVLGSIEPRAQFTFAALLSHMPMKKTDCGARSSRRVMER